MIGQIVGDYRIVKQLGEGGMGMVYLGEHLQLRQKVAIKALHPTLVQNEGAKDRFIREAEVLARLNHPNIIRLLNFYNVPQGCFIVMEYAEGETLEDKLQKTGLIPPAVAAPAFVQILQALEYAHKLGVIHRDLKPSNIMLTADGRAKLLDFGTAKLADAPKLTQQGMTLGTIIYMSKEQLLGRPLDARSDVYSLGVTLYETTTGHLPFYDEEERELVRKIAKQEPIPPSEHYPPMPKELERIILKSLAKEPDQRFASAAEMAQAIERFLQASGSAPVGGPSPGMRGAPTVQAAAPAAAQAPSATEAPGDAGGRSALLSPLVLAGVFLFVVSLGLGGGLLILLASKIPGAVVLVLGVPTSGALGLIGWILGSKKPGAAPAGKRVCPQCGRALLPDLKDCPFCKPAGAAAPPPAAKPPVWGGETLNQGFPGNVPYQAPANVPVTPKGSGTLFIVEGPEKGKQFPLGPRSPVTVGRAPGNTIILTDPGISSNHCSIVHDGSRYVVHDLGARNGVFVNNAKVSRQPISGGDLIVVGTTRILVNITA